jgi:hypothetical protein
MVAAMTDDTDLTRMFAEAALPADDDAFVARVTARIAWRKRLILAMPVGLAALLLLAIWATWPAAYDFSRDVLSGLVLLAVWLNEFFTSPAGMFAAVVLLLTAAAWSWLFDRTRGNLI